MPFKNTTAAALTISVAASALIASPVLADESSPPILTAKTIQVHEVYAQALEDDAGLTPVYSFDVKPVY
ncbi:MAG: hypothetical protein JWQ02_1432 [Capsulimonas sp.]|nr:hypothetical protein [Capsulimonas sp.]